MLYDLPGGQGPAELPEFAQFFVKSGLDPISVTPDSLLKTKRAIAEVEKAIAERKEKVTV